VFTWGRLNPVAPPTPASNQAPTTVAAAAPSEPEPQPPEEEAGDDTISIAVLPFTNMSGLAENQFFSDGISEEILNTLVRVGGLSVASRTSAFRFRDGDRSIPEIAGRLGVRYVLEGSVRRDGGDRVRITAQLIDADTDRHLWSNSYDRELADIFAVQEEIARAIADELGASLELGAEITPDARRTSDATVVELFLRGRELYRQRGVALYEAINVLEEAVARDPKFAPAWVILSQTYQVLPDYFARDDDWQTIAASWGKARYSRSQALMLAPEDHVVRFYHGWQLALLDGDVVNGERVMREALAEDPNNDVLLEDLVELLLRVGQFEEAEAIAARMKEIAPDSAFYTLVLGRTQAVQGRLEEALATMESALALGAQSEFFYADFLQLLISLGNTGRLGEELPGIRAAVAIHPDWVDLEATVDLLEAWLEDGAPDRDLATGERLYFSGSTFLRAGEFLERDRRGGLPINVFYSDFATPYVELSEQPAYQDLIRGSGLLAYWTEFGLPQHCEWQDNAVRCSTGALLD
ncbi:MAG: tetratricopeptide repeat protein, partial [Pseudomonadota bacterium]